MVVDIIFAGVLCCIAMDLWQRLLFVMYKIPPTNWAPTGRWLLMLINKGIIFNVWSFSDKFNVLEMFEEEEKIFLFVKGTIFGLEVVPDVCKTVPHHFHLVNCNLFHLQTNQIPL